MEFITAKYSLALSGKVLLWMTLSRLSKLFKAMGPKYTILCLQPLMSKERTLQKTNSIAARDQGKIEVGQNMR